MDEKPNENWGSAGPYERYVGRWSRKVARDFLAWISVPVGATWADVGWGTGALVKTILAQCSRSRLPVSIWPRDLSRILGTNPSQDGLTTLVDQRDSFQNV
jgi:hypothetical protein